MILCENSAREASYFSEETWSTIRKKSDSFFEEDGDGNV